MHYYLFILKDGISDENKLEYDSILLRGKKQPTTKNTFIL